MDGESQCGLTYPRLTRSERRYLEALAEKLRQMPRQPLPEGYERALDEVFGDCGGELVDRWQPNGTDQAGDGAVTPVFSDFEANRHDGERERNGGKANGKCKRDHHGIPLCKKDAPGPVNEKQRRHLRGCLTCNEWRETLLQRYKKRGRAGPARGIPNRPGACHSGHARRHWPNPLLPPKPSRPSYSEVAAPRQAKETPTLAAGASLCFRVLVLRSANVIQFITT